MNHARLKQEKRFSGFPLSLRLAFWWNSRGARQPTIALDPHRLTDHLRRDIGIDSPRDPWDETAAFWRR